MEDGKKLAVLDNEINEHIKPDLEDAQENIEGHEKRITEIEGKAKLGVKLLAWIVAGGGIAQVFPPVKRFIELLFSD